MSTDAKDRTSTQDSASHIGASDQDLAPGTAVGEYEVEGKIGEGGFGAVYKAVHPLIGKVAAVKVLSRRYSAQPEMVSRFVAEARAVNQIQNRHIIDIFAFGRLGDGRHYYVMEYLDGVTLERYIAERGTLPLADAVAILRAVAKALDAAHGKGIAHRDLKPDNVFLARSEDGTLTPKLLDFGIAKLLSDEDQSKHKTKTGAPMGTPYYMSPEQCRGRDVDHRTDIYAFGVMAYQMLTGTRPFDGEDYMTILMRQMTDEAAPLSALVPDLPPGVDQAVAWMMKKSPSERPPNLVTAVRGLEQAATDAGMVLPATAPSGVYAARTAPLAYHDTPGRITPMHDTPMRDAPTRPSDIGLAATMAPDELASTVAACECPPSAPGQATAAVAAERDEAVATEPDEAGTRRRATVGDVPGAGAGPRWFFLAALAGALVAAAVMYVLVFARGGERSEHTREDTEDSQLRRRGLVMLDLQGTPQGTKVYGPRGLMGVAPGRIQVPRRDQILILSLEAPGYLARSLEVVPDQDRALVIELAPIPGAPPAMDTPPAPPTPPDPAEGDSAASPPAATDAPGSETGSARKRDPGKKGSGKKGSGSNSADKGTGELSDRDTIEDPFKQ